jgi:hypothetical protein
VAQAFPFYMERKMLLEIKKRAELLAAPKTEINR